MIKRHVGLANEVIERILELSSDAHIQRREVAKDSPAFDSLTGAIAAYGKALGLLVALQQRERILRNPVSLERDPSQIGAQKSPRSLWRSLTSSFQFNAN